jgi:transcriptional regulator with XRE-family HTH domain
VRGHRTAGDLLRDRRRALGVSLRGLGARTDLSASFLSDLENGRRIPSEAVAERLAAELGMDGDETLALWGILGERAERWLRRTPAAVALVRRLAQLEAGPRLLAALRGVAR